MSATNEWLPMPSGISLTPHDSFTRDLMRQFDKRRSQILLNNNDTSLSCSSIDDQDRHSDRDSIDHLSNQDSQLSDPNSHYSDQNSHLSNNQNSHDSIAITTSLATRSNTTRNSNLRIEQNENQGIETNRRLSAGNLLRKSSLYLRNKFNNTSLEDQPRASRFHSWTLKSKKKKYKDAQDVFKDSAIQPQQLSKVVINTTINLEQQTTETSPYNTTTTTTTITTNPILPPIITQYPPKPLKYSPVEPLPDISQQDDDDAASSVHHKKGYRTLHRLSLPLLRLTAQQQPAIRRRRSDSDLLEKAPTSMFHSISKQWQKLLYTCSKKKR